MEPLLVTADVVAVWAGRPKGTIYRWGSEGRQGTHRGAGPNGETLYDLRVIPAKSDDGPGQPPPLRKTENADGVVERPGPALQEA